VGRSDGTASRRISADFAKHASTIGNFEMLQLAIRNAVVAAIGDLTGYAPERIRDTDDLARDLGVDSMVAVRLLVAIEDHLGTTLPDGWEGGFVGVATVADLVERLGVVFAAESPATLLQTASPGRMGGA